MGRHTKHSFTALKAHDALNQVKIAIVLIAIIPSLSLFYLSTVVATGDPPYSPATIFLICFLTAAVAAPGFLILKKYPNNIMRLRHYITHISQGTLPERIELEDAKTSDDIQYIEDHFNHVLNSMKERVATAETQLRVEHELRETVEKQQKTLMEAERQRVMIQTLGAACHHLGQPATVLQIQMDLLLKNVTDEDELQQIMECAQEVHRISDILHQLQRTSTFRSIPYIDSESPLDEKIIAINDNLQEEEPLD
jgi:signal transduction histidine kinase